MEVNGDQYYKERAKSTISLSTPNCNPFGTSRFRDSTFVILLAETSNKSPNGSDQC